MSKKIKFLIYFNIVILIGLIIVIIISSFNKIIIPKITYTIIDSETNRPIKNCIGTLSYRYDEFHLNPGGNYPSDWTLSKTLSNKNGNINFSKFIFEENKLKMKKLKSVAIIIEHPFYFRNYNDSLYSNYKRVSISDSPIIKLQPFDIILNKNKFLKYYGRSYGNLNYEELILRKFKNRINKFCDVMNPSYYYNLKTFFPNQYQNVLEEMYIKFNSLYEKLIVTYNYSDKDKKRMKNQLKELKEKIKYKK